jgi:hypothetical protein
LIVRRILALIFLAASVASAQGFGGTAGIGGKAGFGGGATAGSGVSVDGAGTNLLHSGACANDTVATTCTLGSITIPTNGDTIDVVMTGCFGASCSNGSIGTISMTDSCSNSYTYISAASQTSTAGVYQQNRWYAKNISAATCTLIASSTTTESWYYDRASVVYLKGANATTPLDTSVSNVAAATGTAASVTSTGNVSASNEVSLAVYKCPDSTNPTDTGTYTSLFFSNTDNTMTVYYTHPTSGSTTTAAITCSGSGSWLASMAAYKP